MLRLVNFANTTVNAYLSANGLLPTQLGSQTDLAFHVGASSTPGERARITSSGNLLIGGTLPSAPNISLNANGSATFAGQLNVGTTSVYADNAAAKAGGLVDGDVYRKADGTLMIVYT